MLDLWLLPPPLPETLLRSIPSPELDTEENRRAAAFRRPADRLLYVSSHLALRRLLAAYLRTTPERIRLTREPCPGCGGPHGRPRLAGTPEGAPPPLHFSLTHGGGLALMGVASDPVGVDVQAAPDPETVTLCAPALHPAERAELTTLPPEAGPRAFARLWTRKEAYLKGLGTGLTRPASADYLGDATGRRPPGWTVLDLTLDGLVYGTGTDPAAAVAVRRPAQPPPAVRLLPAAVLGADGAARTARAVRALALPDPAGHIPAGQSPAGQSPAGQKPAVPEPPPVEGES